MTFASVFALAATMNAACSAPTSEDIEPATSDFTAVPEGPQPGKPAQDLTSAEADATSPSPDAGADSATGVACEKDASFTYRCSGDGARRSRCVDGAMQTESCARGCLRDSAATPLGTSGDVCMGSTTPWSCPGSYGTKKALDGDYFITAFGCWKDAAGVSHGDGQDNCIPSCLAKAKSEGLCLPGDTGKQCEERVTWYTADAARFGCLARLKVTNPKTGKSVIAVALDYGPSCPAVENKVSKAVLDASGRVDRQLFGSDQGVLDRALVHVVEVDANTPLGPTSP